jgi:adenosine deaminase
MTYWYQRVPKVELHLHLEGAIPLETTWQLMQKYGGDPAIPDLAALRERFAYRDFLHFLDTWVWRNQYIREYEDFTLIAEDVARDLARQNIRYVEAFYSPPDFTTRHGLRTQELTRAIRTGLERVPEIEVRLVADMVRNYGAEAAARTLAEVSEVRDLGVIGVGIGGAELQYPPEPFAAVYEQARRLGLHASAHAGEGAGPESIWGALTHLRAERIGHGTHAIEDETLMGYLAAQQVPLEVCPLSNVRTGVVPSIDAHPVRRFFERGLLITINSDDPKMFHNSLAEEYQLLEERLGFTRAEIRQLILNGIRASWLPIERKQTMLQEFQSDLNWAE